MNNCSTGPLPWRSNGRAPLLEERLRYLSHLAEQGVARHGLQVRAYYQLMIAQCLRLAERPGELISCCEIERQALLWAQQPGPRNRRGQPLTRFGIHALVERYAEKVATKLPSVAKKRVSPHTIRHTTATHVLRSGVDINTIRAWLGHASLSTTNIYAEVDLEMKAKALANC
ncbi:MAG TPA: tyrosine-type recombinase/integrase [Gemmataceae bacterium]|nr:tyrosine-type recombinase/integrase [Gemmataceae bacterium]